MVTTRRALDTQALSSATLVVGVNEESTPSPDIERADRIGDESDHSPPDDASDDSPPEKKFRDHIIGEIWLEIDSSIAENGGSSYGIISAKLNQHKKKFKWINRDLLYNYRKQATREMQLPPHEVSLQPASESQGISELTFDEAERADNGNIDHQDEPEENSTCSVGCFQWKRKILILMRAPQKPFWTRSSTMKSVNAQDKRRFLNERKSYGLKLLLTSTMQRK